MTTQARPKKKTTRAKPKAKARPRSRSRVKTASSKAGRLALSATSASARLGGVATLRGLKLVEAGLVWGLKNQDARRVGALAFLGVVLAVVSQQVRSRVESMDRYRVRSALQLDAPPPGLSDVACNDLLSVKIPGRANTFDPTLVPRLADRLDSLPWVRKVQAVRIAPPNQVRFQLETREPLAQLGPSPKAPLVTRDGAVISRRYGRDADRLPRFVGVPGEAVARSRALDAGAQVLDALGALRERVRQVDLTNLGGLRAPLASEVTLTLASGLVVDWGRAGTTERPQRPAAAKRAALEQFLALPVALRAARVSVRWDRTTWIEKTPEPVAQVPEDR